jgi:CheY-like chemotaxis protein
LLSLARNRPINRQALSLSAHIPRISGMLRSSLRGDIELQITVDPNTGPVEVDVGELEIALLNVALNARDAMPTGGLFTVDVRNLDSARHPPSLAPSPEGFVAITVKDTGTGMPSDVMARAFEPFFTTKKPGSGTGLGLSQVFGFTQGSSGQVEIASELGRGTQITMVIPITNKPVNSATPDTDERAQPLTGCVLLVDDNVEVLGVLRTMITAMGLEVDETDRPTVALEKIVSHPDRFGVVLSDVVMPGVNGVELAREIRSLRPRLSIILMSGYNDVPMPVDFPVVHKPISYAQLYEVLRTALERP